MSWVIALGIVHETRSRCATPFPTPRYPTTKPKTWVRLVCHCSVWMVRRFGQRLNSATTTTLELSCEMVTAELGKRFARESTALSSQSFIFACRAALSSDASTGSSRIEMAVLFFITDNVCTENAALDAILQCFVGAPFFQLIAPVDNKNT